MSKIVLYSERNITKEELRSLEKREPPSQYIDAIVDCNHNSEYNGLKIQVAASIRYDAAFGIDGMTSGLAALLMSAGPFYAILLSHFFTNDKFNRYKFLGTVIGFISVFILFYDQVYISKTTTIFSVLIVMSASLSYVIGGLIIQKYREYNNETIATLSMICGTIILLPICIFKFSELDFDQVEMTSVLSLIYLGIVSTAIAFMIRAKLIFENGLIFMSQVSLLIPIFGLYFSWLFLSEQFSVNMFVSLIIILFGLWVLQIGYKKINS